MRGVYALLDADANADAGERQVSRIQVLVRDGRGLFIPRAKQVCNSSYFVKAYILCIVCESISIKQIIYFYKSLNKVLCGFVSRNSSFTARGISRFSDHCKGRHPSQWCLAEKTPGDRDRVDVNVSTRPINHPNSGHNLTFVFFYKGKFFMDPPACKGRTDQGYVGLAKEAYPLKPLGDPLCLSMREYQAYAQGMSCPNPPGFAQLFELLFC